ncbi:MAG: phosphoribosylglycinamide formyltransferase [Clostridiales bacterium]|nr:phosphoribosylglycinamide formyltransferase [Clostridiales bacterium]
MVKTAVLVSGGGKNLQSLIDARMFGEIPDCELTAVISSNPSAYALKRAEIAGLRRYIIDREMFPSDSVFTSAVTDKLRDLDIELVILAGFDFPIPDAAFKYFEGRIISTGDGLMTQLSAREVEDESLCAAALEAGLKKVEARAFFVTRESMENPIISQKFVEVQEDDSPRLRARLLEKGENELLPKAVNLFCRGLLKLLDGKVINLSEKTDEGEGEKAEEKPCDKD